MENSAMSGVAHSAHEKAEVYKGDDGKVTGRMQRYVHQGPLPDPMTLANYEKLMPGLAERVVRMAEKEQEHRHECDRTRNESNKQIISVEANRQTGIQKAETLGQKFGFTISIVAVASALLATWMKQPAVAIALVSLPVMSVIKAFLSGQGVKDEEAKTKSTQELEASKSSPNKPRNQRKRTKR